MSSSVPESLSVLRIGSLEASHGFTVKVAVLLTTLPEVAVIEVLCEVLTLCPVAIPVLAIVAALVLDDFQVTAFVMSTWLPFCNVPIAVNDSV